MLYSCVRNGKMYNLFWLCSRMVLLVWNCVTTQCYWARALPLRWLNTYIAIIGFCSRLYTGFSSSPNKFIRNSVLKSVGHGLYLQQIHIKILFCLDCSSKSLHLLLNESTFADSIAVLAYMLVSWSLLSLAAVPRSETIPLCTCLFSGFRSLPTLILVTQVWWYLLLSLPWYCNIFILTFSWGNLVLRFIGADLTVIQIWLRGRRGSELFRFVAP